MSLTFSYKKKKLLATEGTSAFRITYQLDPLRISCQCTGKQYEICNHLREYYTSIGVKKHYLQLLSIPRLRCWFSENESLDPSRINSHICDFLESETDGCVICMQPYISVVSPERQVSLIAQLYQCPQCSEPYHSKCFTRWNKDCPRCNYNKDINQGKDDVNWPLLVMENQ